MTADRRRKVLGWGAIALALVVNRPLIEALLVPDGTIGSPVVRGVILVFQLAALAAGVLILTRTRVKLPSFLARPWVLVLASVVLSVVLMEVVLRLPGLARPWIPPRTFVGQLENEPSEHFMSDPFIGWRMRPHAEFRWLIEGRWSSYTANDAGYRTPYTGAPDSQPGGTVLLIGDSFAFGTGVEYPDTFAAVLDSLLGEVRVYNMAMPGFGIDQMGMAVRHYAIPASPAAIVVAFIDNDLDRSLYAYRTGEDMNKPTFVLDADTLRPQQPGDRPPALVSWLEGHSAGWNLGRHAVRAAGHRRAVGDWWRVNQVLFTRMWQDASRSGVPILFVRLPLRSRVPFPQLQALMSRLGAPFLDLQEAGTPGAIHFPVDGHINGAGHRFVAERLAPVLEGLMDRPPE